jgi:hypothetical protein
MFTNQKRHSYRFTEIILFTIIIILILTSCNYEEILTSSSKNHSRYNPINNVNIEKLFDNDVINQIEVLGINIYRGQNPPLINGTYLAEHWDIDTINHEQQNFIAWEAKRYHMTMKLEYQNYSDLTIRLTSWGERYDSGNAEIAYISGYNNYFTIYWKSTEKNNLTAHSNVKFNVISGEIIENGIENLKYATCYIKTNSQTSKIKGSDKIYSIFGTVFSKPYGIIEKL